VSKCETCHYWSVLPEERSPDYGVCVYLTGMQHVDCPPVFLKRELVIRTADNFGCVHHKQKDPIPAPSPDEEEMR
jgi:hypothetical protein